jgi:hypothetical protein
VSILSQRSADGVLWAPDTRVCVWFVETETFGFYDLGCGMSPLAQFWDAVDARLLAVHCIPLPSEAAAAAGGDGGDGAEGSGESDDSNQQRMVHAPAALAASNVVNLPQVLLFASIDKGVILSDTVPFIEDLGVVGLHTPHTLVLQKPQTAGGLPRVTPKARGWNTICTECWFR